MKVACPVWSGGKGGDNFKTLPIAIVDFLQNKQCFGHIQYRLKKGNGHVPEMPVPR